MECLVEEESLESEQLAPHRGCHIFALFLSNYCFLTLVCHPYQYCVLRSLYYTLLAGIRLHRDSDLDIVPFLAGFSALCTG
jgi:hypothetical protein